MKHATGWGQAGRLNAAHQQASATTFMSPTIFISAGEASVEQSFMDPSAFSVLM